MIPDDLQANIERTLTMAYVIKQEEINAKTVVRMPAILERIQPAKPMPPTKI